jgi:hypothetical protein
MKALIIYDDFASAARASATLQQSAQSPAASVQWNIIPWRLDLLKFPPTAEEALTEALGAHLVVFAGPCAQWIPVWLQNWLDHWAKCRRISDAALAVFGAGNARVLAPLATSGLSGFAKRHGLSLIFYDGGAVEDGTAFSIAGPYKRELPLSPAQNGRLSWGINE